MPALINRLTFIFFTFVAACNNGSNGEYVDKPYVDFECSAFQAAACDSSNIEKKTFLGLHINRNINCASALAHSPISVLQTTFDYSSIAYTKEYAPGVLTGLFANWISLDRVPVVTLSLNTYRVCAFIDVNSNDQLDAFEPFHESELEIGNDFNPLSNWSNY